MAKKLIYRGARCPSRHGAMTAPGGARQPASQSGGASGGADAASTAAALAAFSAGALHGSSPAQAALANARAAWKEAVWELAPGHRYSSLARQWTGAELYSKIKGDKLPAQHGCRRSGGSAWGTVEATLAGLKRRVAEAEAALKKEGKNTLSGWLGGAPKAFNAADGAGAGAGPGVRAAAAAVACKPPAAVAEQRSPKATERRKGWPSGRWVASGQAQPTPAVGATEGALPAPPQVSVSPSAPSQQHSGEVHDTHAATQRQQEEEEKWRQRQEQQPHRPRPEQPEQPVQPVRPGPPYRPQPPAEAERRLSEAPPVRPPNNAANGAEQREGRERTRDHVRAREHERAHEHERASEKERNREHGSTREREHDRDRDRRREREYVRERDHDRRREHERTRERDYERERIRDDHSHAHRESTWRDARREERRSGGDRDARWAEAPTQSRSGYPEHRRRDEGYDTHGGYELSRDRRDDGYDRRRRDYEPPPRAAYDRGLRRDDSRIDRRREHDSSDRRQEASDAPRKERYERQWPDDRRGYGRHADERRDDRRATARAEGAREDPARRMTDKPTLKPAASAAPSVLKGESGATSSVSRPAGRREGDSEAAATARVVDEDSGKAALLSLLPEHWPNEGCFTEKHWLMPSHPAAGAVSVRTLARLARQGKVKLGEALSPDPSGKGTALVSKLKGSNATVEVLMKLAARLARVLSETNKAVATPAAGVAPVLKSRAAPAPSRAAAKAKAAPMPSAKPRDASGAAPGRSAAQRATQQEAAADVSPSEDSGVDTDAEEEEETESEDDAESPTDEAVAAATVACLERLTAAEMQAVTMRMLRRQVDKALGIELPKERKTVIAAAYERWVAQQVRQRAEEEAAQSDESDDMEVELDAGVAKGADGTKGSKGDEGATMQAVTVSDDKPEEKGAERAGMWTCMRCSFAENTISETQCAACSARRPREVGKRPAPAAAGSKPKKARKVAKIVPIAQEGAIKPKPAGRPRGRPPKSKAAAGKDAGVDSGRAPTVGMSARGAAGSGDDLSETSDEEPAADRARLQQLLPRGWWRPFDGPDAMSAHLEKLLGATRWRVTTTLGKTGKPLFSCRHLVAGNECGVSEAYRNCAAADRRVKGVRTARRLVVFWADDGEWYQGRVVSWDGTTAKITYDDGEEEQVRLADQLFMWSSEDAETREDAELSEEVRAELEAERREERRARREKRRAARAVVVHTVSPEVKPRLAPAAAHTSCGPSWEGGCARMLPMRWRNVVSAKRVPEGAALSDPQQHNGFTDRERARRLRALRGESREDEGGGKGGGATVSQRGARASLRATQGALFNSGWGDEYAHQLATSLGRREKYLLLRRSAIHSFGVLAGEVIQAGEFIVEYVGETVGKVVGDQREQAYERSGMGSTYLFAVGQDTIIDATRKGTIARYANHSCDPSCESRIVETGGERRVVLYSKRRIEVGEELTYDYKLPYEEGEDRIPCRCGTKVCRGFLN